MQSDLESGDAVEVTRSSLVQRLVNVFVAPGEVFEDVKASPVAHLNWVVPLLLGMVAGVLFVQIVFSQPAVLRETRDLQAAKIQEKVDDGSMTQKDADVAIERMDTAMKPGIVKIFGSVGVVFATVFLFCFLAFFLWVLGKWPLRSSISYGKASEVVGISTMINVLGSVVVLLLVMIKGSLYVNLGPSLLLSKIDPLNDVHQILMALNLVQFWFMGVLSVGLARMSGASTGRCAALIFGIWACYKAVTILLF